MGEAPDVSRRRLGNGVRLITVPMRDRAGAALSFTFQVGSRIETESNAGIAHFIEHMVFKGGRKYSSAYAISAAIEAAGGDLNADTGREATQFWTKVPAGHLRTALEVLADMLLHPRFEAAEVAKERAVVIEELRMYADNPQDHVQTLFEEVMWPGHPLGWEVAGREETVARFTSDDCRTHTARHYRPESLLVTVAGDVAGDEVMESVEALTGDWHPVSEEAPVASPPPPLSGDRLRAQGRDTEQANVIMGSRWISQHHPLRYAADLLNVVLGEGMSSRLFVELREKRALVYDVHSFAIRLRDTGALGIAFGCEPKRVADAMQRALEELRALTVETVAPAELQRAKEFIKGHLLMQMDGSGGRGAFYAQQELAGEELLAPAQVIARVEAVTPEEMLEVARLAVQDGLRAAAIGPRLQTGVFEEVLARA